MPWKFVNNFAIGFFGTSFGIIAQCAGNWSLSELFGKLLKINRKVVNKNKKENIEKKPKKCLNKS